jgi:hypothetical protein
LTGILAGLPMIVNAFERMAFPSFTDNTDPFAKQFGLFVQAFEKGDAAYIERNMVYPVKIEGTCAESSSRAQPIYYTKKELFMELEECVVGEKTYTLPRWQVVLGMCKGKRGLGLNVFRFHTFWAPRAKQTSATWRLGEFYSRLDFKMQSSVWKMTGGSYYFPCPYKKTAKTKDE